VQSARKCDFLGIILLKKNPWTMSTDRSTASARSTMDRQTFPRLGAHRSSASDRSGARELRPRGGGGEGWAGEFNDGVAAGREAVGVSHQRWSLSSEGQRGGHGEG
jgi:hypothetical protein